MTLYASPYGRRYHRFPDCNGLNATLVAECYSATIPTITRATANRRGLTPCAVCKPPPLLSVVPSTRR